MLFRNIYLKSLRDYRIAILGWGLGIGLLILVVLSSFPSLVETAAARASLVSLGPSFAWIAEPLKIDTPGGYATFKYGFTVLIMALWPILACSRMLRGEEERGSMDELLSMPRGRGRVALEKLAAMWTALLSMGLLIGLLTYTGGMRVNADFSFGDAIISGINLSLICGVFGSIALLISQFTQERGSAAGWTGGLLLIFIVLDMVHRVVPNSDWISHLSPVYYYNLNKPLVPGFGINPGALLVLVALSIILSGAAIWLFVGRDIGGTVKLPGWLHLPERAPGAEQALPVNAWSLRSVYTRGLGMMRVSASWWTIAIAGLAAWMVVIVKQTESQLATIAASSPILKDVITKVGGGDIATNAAILSALFVFMPLLLMAFAVTQVNRWAADEEDGRLEMVLSTPQPRLNVLLARFAALSTLLVIMGFVTLAATELATLAAGLKLDGGNVAAASLGMIPMGLLIAALGFLFSGWLRTAIDTGLLSFLLVIWFFITFIGPELNWPDALQKLSAFYYYGTPLLHGLSAGNTLLLLAVAAVALVLASVRFVRKDIGR
jgi:ABC-2 type transport system permease protein